MNRVEVENASFNGRRVDHFSDVAAVLFVVWAQPDVITSYKPHLECKKCRVGVIMIDGK